MKLTIEVDQNKWREIVNEIPYNIDETLIECATVYAHAVHIYLIVYDWDNGIYTIMRPCGKPVCCVTDYMITQGIVELIVTNQS